MYITNHLHGGLGNMMFQISAAWAYARRTNRKYRYSKYTKSPHDIDLNLFRFATANFIFLGENNRDFSLYREPSFEYNEIPNIEGNVFLDGYFQSDKYFKDILSVKELRDRFYCPQKTLEYPFIHVRRGDYLALSEYHTVLGIDYYNKAMELLPAEKYYVVSNDIAWCKENFSDSKFMIVDEDHISTFHLMTSCRSGIIANSSFSWWGAYLSIDPQLYIAPKNWFGPKYSHNDTTNLYNRNMVLV